MAVAPRVVVITGASGGLGKVIARRFASEGDHLVLTYFRNQAGVQQLTRELAGAGTEAIWVQADLRRADQVALPVTAAVKEWGRLDVLINNAGGSADGLLPRMRREDWDSVLRLNLDAPHRLIRLAIEEMGRLGFGHVVNIGSYAGVMGRAGQAHYAAAKAGLIGITRATAREAGPLGIRINLVIPAALPVGMTIRMRDRSRSRLVEPKASNLNEDSIPGPEPSAEEVAEFVSFLTRLRSVSGQVFHIDHRVPPL